MFGNDSVERIYDMNNNCQLDNITGRDSEHVQTFRTIVLMCKTRRNLLFKEYEDMSKHQLASVCLPGICLTFASSPISFLLKHAVESEGFDNQKHPKCCRLCPQIFVIDRPERNWKLCRSENERSVCKQLQSMLRDANHLKVVLWDSTMNHRKRDANGIPPHKAITG